MDYKEKYEQALARAKEILECSPNPDARDVKMVLSFFPELKESDDEKVRKDIISLVDEFWAKIGSIHPEFTTHDKMIAWLEKQGEQKPADKVEPKFKVGDKIKLAREPKYPAREIIAIKNDAYYFDELVYLPLRGQDEWELVEQKPAWSEEDEFFFGWISATLDNNTRHCPKSKETNKSCKKWLQSLKDRVQPQPKQEWSEEDENFLKEAIRMIEMPGSWFKGKDLQNKIVNWLNSLRPQSHWTGTTKEQIDTIAQHLENLGNVAMANELFNLHIEPYWKPSDEELYSLKEVMNIVGSKYKSCLNSLYSDLMKLREE